MSIDCCVDGDCLRCRERRNEGTIMATIRQDLETVREDLMKAYSRLGKYRKMHSMVKYTGQLKIIREHIHEGAEVLQEFIEENLKE